MPYRSGHFAYQRDPAQMRELLPLGLQLQVGLLLRTNVNCYANDF